MKPKLDVNKFLNFILITQKTIAYDKLFKNKMNKKLSEKVHSVGIR